MTGPVGVCDVQIETTAVCVVEFVTLTYAYEVFVPVLTVVGAQLATPGLMVEVEVDAIAGLRLPP